MSSSTNSSSLGLPVRWIVMAILLVALALRIGFVLTMPDTPLYWDERHYDTWAQVHQGFWTSLFGGGEGPSLHDAFRASRQKGELFVGMVGAIYALIGRHPRAIFYLQALLDTLTCLLLFDLTRAMAGVRAGLVALALAALYEPFIFSVARLQTETLSSLLYVAGLWAICVPSRRRARSRFAGGVLLAAAMLTKPALQYVLVFLLPAVVAANWNRIWRERLRVAALVAAGFLAGVTPHLILSTGAVGGSASIGMLGNGPDIYAGIVYANAGWKSSRMAFANPPPDALLAVLGNDAARLPTEADYRAAAIRTWMSHPLQSTAVSLHKLYVAWRSPYNDSRATLVFGRTGETLFHQVVLCLALVGLPLALRHWRVALPVVATTAYIWLVYLSVKIEARYAVTAMPMMICFAGVAVGVLSRGWQQAWRAGERHVLIAAATAAILLGLAVAGGIPRLLAWMPVGPAAANGFRIALMLSAMGACGYLAAELARPLWPRSRARAALAPALAVAALIVLAGRPLAQDWREWRSTLSPSGGIVGQEFVLPSDIQAPLAAALTIDMLPEPPQGSYDLVVRVNGDEITRYRGAPTRADANLPGDGYELLYEVRQPAGEATKAWYVIPIPAALIAPGARVAVEVALEGPDAGGSLVIFGDSPPDAATYIGPSLLSPRNNADTSISKYLVDGDSRLRRQMPLSGAAHSRFHDGVGWTDRDLAVDAGRQQGRYRLFLVLTYDRGVVIM